MDQAISTDSLDDARSSLDWWLTAGVDTLIDEAPRNWLAPRKMAAAQVVADRTPASVQAPLPAAHASSVLPESLDALRRRYETQPDLPFAGAGTTRIMPSGDPASGLMMLADMPTSEDAAAGLIFSGDCGVLFDRMLAAIGRDRASIYLATLSCLAAPGGRLDAEAAGRCGALAKQHVRLAAPRRLLLLGEAATRVMTGLSLPDARGRMHAIDLGEEFGGGRVNAIATFHPRYLLTRSSAKAGAWADLQLLAGELNA